MKCRLRMAVCLLISSFVSVASAQKSREQEKLAIVYPGKTWAVQIDSPGFVVKQNEHQSDGREYLSAENSKTKIFLSVMLEQGNGPADSAGCPDYLASRVRSLPQDIKATDVHSFRISQIPVIEYLIPSAQSMPVRQKNLVACLTKEDVYIDVHLSKALFVPSEEALFTDLVNKISIIDAVSSVSKSAPPAASDFSTENNASSLDYMRMGSAFYIANDFQKAIGPYQQALDLERRDPKLDRTMWLVLVDNLGMAYGITGDLKQAEDTLNYGVNKDPTYPMFYYNLACVNAERGDMDKTMDYLRKGFSLKANAIQGEEMPDPRHDDSFQRFMSNDRFRKFVDSLYASN